jgi:hypothetical protein
LLSIRNVDTRLAVAGHTLLAASNFMAGMDCGCILLGVPSSFASSGIFSNAADTAGVVGLDQASDLDPGHAPF